MSLIDGRTFVEQSGRKVPPIWGTDEAVAWAEGEPLIIAAPPGVGKTTLAQQITLARLGVGGASPVLGMPVIADAARPTLYIAADRPRQIARSLARMVHDDDVAAILAQRLLVWQGPTPTAIDRNPDGFAQWVLKQNAGTVVLDSLKDLTGNLAESEVGARVNRALQLVISAGVEVLVLHHQRKPQADNTKPRKLGDVFGSAWITAGAGSVILLWGEAGDPVVELRHLKQPAGDIGPLRVLHDHRAGRSTVVHEGTLPDLLKRAGDHGLAVRDAARLLYGCDDPSRSDVERARRKLEELSNAIRVEPSTAGDPVRYRWKARDPRDPQRDGSRDGSRTSENPDKHWSREGHGPSQDTSTALIEGRAKKRDPALQMPIDGSKA